MLATQKILDVEAQCHDVMMRDPEIWLLSPFYFEGQWLLPLNRCFGILLTRLRGY